MQKNLFSNVAITWYSSLLKILFWSIYLSIYLFMGSLREKNVRWLPNTNSCPILFNHKKTIEQWMAAQCYFQFSFLFIFTIFHWNNIEQPPNIIFWVFFLGGFFLLLFIQYYGEILSVNFLILFTHKKNIKHQVAIQCSFQKNYGHFFRKNIPRNIYKRRK